VYEGCFIINNSWSSYDFSYTIRTAFADAFRANIVPVAAMGNQETITTRYPAGYGGVLAVGATNINDEKPDFSNWGNHNDVVAPGVGIVSLEKSSDDDYTTTSGRSGTSYATAHVSGLASLMLSIDGALDNDDIENIIEISADNVEEMEGEDWTDEYGHGRLNAYRALQYLQPPYEYCLLYTSPSPRDATLSRMPSSA